MLLLPYCHAHFFIPIIFSFCRESIPPTAAMKLQIRRQRQRGVEATNCTPQGHGFFTSSRPRIVKPIMYCSEHDRHLVSHLSHDCRDSFGRFGPSFLDISPIRTVVHCCSGKGSFVPTMPNNTDHHRLQRPVATRDLIKVMNLASEENLRIQF